MLGNEYAINIHILYYVNGDLKLEYLSTNYYGFSYLLSSLSIMGAKFMKTLPMLVLKSILLSKASDKMQIITNITSITAWLSLNLISNLWTIC